MRGRWPGSATLRSSTAGCSPGRRSPPPRLADVPVRMPLPPPLRQGSIYETQAAAGKSYFGRAA